MKKKLAWLPLVALLVGCSENAHSLSRDYRNLNNDAIDALMMVTSESRATVANTKVFKPYSDRLAAIDKRYETWIQNTDDKVIILDTMTSESVAVLLSENAINKRRLQLERQRLQKLLDDFKDKRIERLKLAGEANPVVDPRKEWPNLADLVGGAPVNGLKSNLDTPGRFGGLVPKFEREWKKQLPPNFADLSKALAEKVKVLELPPP
jgi:hypothetical protein